MTVTIGNKVIHLMPPDNYSPVWVGQKEAMQQLLAAWISLSAGDEPMSPRIVGKPGLGKTTLCAAAAACIEKDLYIFQASSDTRPEDLIITPVLDKNRRIIYQASTLVSAMIKGGVFLLDEGNRMKERSWAALAPLLDKRRYIESVIAGIKIPAHQDFRFCTTMNEDGSTFEIPEYIRSRLRPRIVLEFPEGDEEAILRANLPAAPKKLVPMLLELLETSRNRSFDISFRDLIAVGAYALRLQRQTGTNLTRALKKSALSVMDAAYADLIS